MKNLELLILIALSWVAIWIYNKGNLSVLGLKPTTPRLKYAALLFAVTAICCSTGFFMRMYFAEEQFAFNPKIDTALILSGIWLNFESVLFEELLCRGVALYILIKKVGQKPAILITAAAFAILHLLNPGALGSVGNILSVFSFTFAMGLLLGYAFAKTYSLYIPFAIHFGWNLTQNFIFPDGPFENTLFISALQPIISVSYVIYFTMLLLPKISAVVIDYLIVRRHSLLG